LISTKRRNCRKGK